MLALGNKNFTLRTDVGDLIETTVNKSTIAIIILFHVN
jgi:hypothetical protein